MKNKNSIKKLFFFIVLSATCSSIKAFFKKKQTTATKLSPEKKRLHEKWVRKVKQERREFRELMKRIEETNKRIDAEKNLQKYEKLLARGPLPEIHLIKYIEIYNLTELG